jgi:hypothetical protein
MEPNRASNARARSRVQFRKSTREASLEIFKTEAQAIELRSCPAYIREWITNERESRLFADEPEMVITEGRRLLVLLLSGVPDDRT